MSTSNQGADFKNRREAVGVSQHSLSIKSGIPRTRLSAFECGYIDLREEESRTLECTLKELVKAKQQRLEAVLATA